MKMEKPSNCHALFPLTPALSPGERGKRSQSFGETMAEFCTMTFEVYKSSQRLFPLPKGEGQGEGKAASNRYGSQIFSTLIFFLATFVLAGCSTMNPKNSSMRPPVKL